MAFFRHIQTLMDVETFVAENQYGLSYAILPSDNDAVPDHLTSWRVFIDATQEGGGTGPTTDVLIETSHGDNQWVLVASATQLTGNGEVNEFKEIEALGPYIRARSLLSGAPKPQHKVTVKLASNAPFRLVVFG